MSPSALQITPLPCAPSARRIATTDGCTRSTRSGMLGAVPDPAPPEPVVVPVVVPPVVPVVVPPVPVVALGSPLLPGDATPYAAAPLGDAGDEPPESLGRATVDPL